MNRKDKHAKRPRRPRFSIPETEELVKMLKNRSTTSLAAGILANSVQVVPWRYVRQIRDICRHDEGAAWLTVAERNGIDYNQSKKRSRIEKKKIWAKDSEF